MKKNLRWTSKFTYSLYNTVVSGMRLNYFCFSVPLFFLPAKKKKKKVGSLPHLGPHKIRRKHDITPISLSSLLFLVTTTIPTLQHGLREETETRASSRAKQVLDRVEGARRAMAEEESLRDAARIEDQTAGPWGFEKVKDGLAPGFGGGGGGGGVGAGASRKLASGPRDGLGVFKVSVGDDDKEARPREMRAGGKKKKEAGVDDGEVQLFQPLQQAAHEERYGDRRAGESMLCVRAHSCPN